MLVHVPTPTAIDWSRCNLHMLVLNGRTVQSAAGEKVALSSVLNKTKEEASFTGGIFADGLAMLCCLGLGCPYWITSIQS